METRVKAEKSKKEGDIFEAKKEAYKPSEQRKADQAAVDAQVILPTLLCLKLSHIGPKFSSFIRSQILTFSSSHIYFDLPRSWLPSSATLTAPS